MRTLIEIVLAASLVIFGFWTHGELSLRNNQIRDAQEEVNFLGNRIIEMESSCLRAAVRLDGELKDLESDVLIAERQVRSLRKKVEIMETTGLKCIQSLSETYRDMFTVFVAPLRVWPLSPSLSPSLSPARSSNGSDAGLSRQ